MMLPRLTSAKRTLGRLLLEGRHVPTAELIAAFYGDDPNGGPVSADARVRHHVMELRRILAPFSIQIRSEYAAGWYVESSDISRLRALLDEEHSRFSDVRRAA